MLNAERESARRWLGQPGTWTQVCALAERLASGGPVDAQGIHEVLNDVARGQIEQRPGRRVHEQPRSEQRRRNARILYFRRSEGLTDSLYRSDTAWRRHLHPVGAVQRHRHREEHRRA